MKFKSISMVVVLLSFATGAAAQTKISGTLNCGKANPQHIMAVGDRPNHAFMLSKFNCTWRKRMEIGGIQNKEGVATSFDEVSGNTSRFRGYYVDAMANGDQAQYRYEGTFALKDGVPESGEDKWNSVRATGKLKGLKSHGTCKGKGGGDGGVTWECEGEYELPK